uniref:K Homology domain-containing protein n=1 Tax=Leersia perrieri TaxID=77586 RepID=A0A0D9X8D8_9ORYZ
MTPKVGGVGITLTAATRILKGEIACGVIDKQCQREIGKQEGFVLRVPYQGFDTSVTHRELIEMHGYVFDRSLKTEIELIKKHDYVFDEFHPRSQLPDGKGPHVKKIPKGGFPKSVIRIPKKIVPFLQGRGHHKMKHVAHCSGAMVHITGTVVNNFREVILQGRNDEITEAERLVQKFIQEISVETIYIGRDAHLTSAIIEDIERRSGTHIKVCEVTDKSAEQPVEITGNAVDIKTAKRIVTQVASKEKAGK